VSTPPTHRSVALGFVGAVVATILGAAVSPEIPQTAISVFARAAAYILVVFATAATTTYLGLLVRGEGRAIRAKQVAGRTAAATLWLPPLLMFSDQRSWFVLVIWALLVVEVARLVAFLRATSHDNAVSLPQPPLDGKPFSVLKQDFPSGISILGALMIQGAIFSAVGGHAILAGLLYLAGTAAIAYRTLQMFQALPALNNRTWRQRIPAVFISATFLIVFAWLPHIVVPGRAGVGGDSKGTAANGRRSTEGWQANGSGAGKDKHIEQGTATAMARLRALFVPRGSESRGNSFAVAKRILDSTLAQPSDGTSARLKSSQNTKVAAAVVVAGPVFAGVELYPEVEPHPRLVAPPLTGTRGFGTTRSDPLSIPFDGVYWFWRGPSDQPPSNSVVMHGSPSARFFRSTDGDGMSMEARQNLGFMVDPKRYGAIEISIENADPFPNTVSILLKVRNTTIPGKPILSLGMEGVSAPASSMGSGTATTQTLRFRIPSAIPIGSFDELTVSYYLKGARSNRSARIAIDRFRLVPRGDRPSLSGRQDGPCARDVNLRGRGASMRVGNNCPWSRSRLSPPRFATFSSDAMMLAPSDEDCGGRGGPRYR